MHGFETAKLILQGNRTLQCIFDRSTAVSICRCFDGPFGAIRFNLHNRNIKVRSRQTTTVTQRLYNHQRTVVSTVIVPSAPAIGTPAA